MNDPASSTPVPPVPPSRRHSLPPAPARERVEVEVAAGAPGALGFVLWRLLRAVKLWGEVDEAERHRLFHPPPAAERERLAEAMRSAPEVASALESLAVLLRFPQFGEPARVAEACREVSAWARTRGRVEAAVQFAEAATLADPFDPRAAADAGQACHLPPDFLRAVAWYQRAIVLARRAGDWEWYARAHLRFGYLYLETGRGSEASALYLKAWRAAKRTGRRSLGGCAQHDLFALAVTSGDHSAAQSHALEALELYPVYDPRLARLALDFGAMLIRNGLEARARAVLEAAEPLWESTPLRLLGLSQLALVHARLGRRSAFEKLSAQVLGLLAETQEFAAAAMVYVAEGERLRGGWVEAESLLARALEISVRRNEADVSSRAALILEQGVSRAGQERRHHPPEPVRVRTAANEIVRRLEKQRARH